MEILNGYVTLDLGIDELTQGPKTSTGLYTRFGELINLRKPIMITPVKIDTRIYASQFIEPVYTDLDTATIYFKLDPVYEGTTVNNTSNMFYMVSVKPNDTIKYAAVKYVEQA